MLHIVDHSSLLCLWTCIYDALRHIAVLFEVVDEHTRKLLSLNIVCFLVSPALTGIEDLVRNVRACLGNHNIEDRMKLILNIVKLALQCSRYHRTGVLYLHAASDAIGAAGPTGVDKEYVCAVLIDLLAEHLCIE